MKKYIVHDLQGGSFMGYSHEEPLTAQQIRAIRWQDYIDNMVDDEPERMKYKHFTMAFIADVWELDFETVTA